jgi:hypothetical protein
MNFEAHLDASAKLNRYEHGTPETRLTLALEELKTVIEKMTGEIPVFVSDAVFNQLVAYVQKQLQAGVFPADPNYVFRIRNHNHQNIKPGDSVWLNSEATELRAYSKVSKGVLVVDNVIQVLRSTHTRAVIGGIEIPIDRLTKVY